MTSGAKSAIAAWEVTCLDISRPSLALAESKLRKHGLEQPSNVIFWHANLLNLHPADIGFFDLVVATGVLHHLADPSDGVRTLAMLLRKGGGIHMLFYGATDCVENQNHESSRL